MKRVIAGVVSALLLVTAGVFVWRAQAGASLTLPNLTLPKAPAEASSSAPMGLADLAGPPSASEKTREEKRFTRYDRDKNGSVGRDEYLESRRKAFAKLDLDHDGKLSFDEYAIKTEAKFAAADKDRSGTLTAPEFATTRVVRKSPPPSARCKPTLRTPRADEAEQG